MLSANKPSLNQPGFGRWAADHNQEPILWEYTQKILPVARKAFNSETLVPSYTLFSHYEGTTANLYKHKDDNACTYTLDVNLYYKTENWDLWVEGVPYTVPVNGAVAFYGEEQEHWREAFPDAENNNLGVIFFHFVEPEHWWVKEGPGYLDVIRKVVTEEEWNQRKQQLS